MFCCAVLPPGLYRPSRANVLPVAEAVYLFCRRLNACSRKYEHLSALSEARAVGTEYLLPAAWRCGVFVLGGTGERE